MKQTEKLRQLIAREGAVIAPCAYDALTARIIETSGFELIGTTGVTECMEQFLEVLTTVF